jgi:hypothetical protein
MSCIVLFTFHIMNMTGREAMDEGQFSEGERLEVLE